MYTVAFRDIIAAFRELGFYHPQSHSTPSTLNWRISTSIG